MTVVSIAPRLVGEWVRLRPQSGPRRPGWGLFFCFLLGGVLPFVELDAPKDRVDLIERSDSFRPDGRLHAGVHVHPEGHGADPAVHARQFLDDPVAPSLLTTD
mgnify:CR=1 FL=1